MFWENFQKLCSEAGKSPNAVAKELRISSGTVTEWKKGRSPQNATALKVADYFGITVGELTGEPIKEKAPPPIVDDEAERLKRVLLYFEDLQKQGSRTDLEKVSETERDLLSLFRQFPEDSQRLYLEALRASLKK